LESLIAAGFVSRRSNTKEILSTVEDSNQASDYVMLTSYCLVAGLFPNTFTLMRLQKGGSGEAVYSPKMGISVFPSPAHINGRSDCNRLQSEVVGKDA
jgi:hypothetical protein